MEELVDGLIDGSIHLMDKYGSMDEIMEEGKEGKI